MTGEKTVVCCTDKASCSSLHLHFCPLAILSFSDNCPLCFSSVFVSHFLKQNLCTLRYAIYNFQIIFRYLGSGNSFRSLHFEFLLGRSSIARIIRDTCVVIWETLRKEFMKQPTTEDWLDIAQKYEIKANFPHCVGAIDGKHIRITKPRGSASEFFNYKKFFSIVLVAVADSNYCFRYIDVGGYGHEGDSNLFKATDLGKKIYTQALNLPLPTSLPNCPSGTALPFVFVADEAFALCENLLRPYPAKNLTPQKKVFNYRLSRARRFVECAFGILANKWRILHRPIDVNVEFVDSIVKTCCVLHNYVRVVDGYNFEDTLTCPLTGMSACGTRGNTSGKLVRDHFSDYFCSDYGSVPWQNNCTE